MFTEFSAEDLICLLIDRKEVDNQVRIEYKKINSMRDTLRSKGIRFDLGARELDTIQIVYPNNIILEETCLIVNITDSFVSNFKRRSKRVAYFSKIFVKLNEKNT